MKFEIDLHGLSHNEAVKKVESELISISLQKYYTVEIITGKSKEMQRKIINEVLEPQKFFYYIPLYNGGIIIVYDDILI